MIKDLHHLHGAVVTVFQMQQLFHTIDRLKYLFFNGYLPRKGNKTDFQAVHLRYSYEVTSTHICLKYSNQNFLKCARSIQASMVPPCLDSNQNTTSLSASNRT